jgi:hypothetical protein
MSRRNRNRQQAQAFPPPPPPATEELPEAEAVAAVAEVVPDRLGSWRLRPEEVEGMAPDFFAELRKRARCIRQIVYRDGLIWRCACGATGPMGRSSDGIPFEDETILAHAPGETRT